MVGRWKSSTSPRPARNRQEVDMKELFGIFRRLFAYNFLIRNFGILGQSFVVKNILKRLTERRIPDRIDRRQPW